MPPKKLKWVNEAKEGGDDGNSASSVFFGFGCNSKPDQNLELAKPSDLEREREGLFLCLGLATFTAVGV